MDEQTAEYEYEYESRLEYIVNAVKEHNPKTRATNKYTDAPSTTNANETRTEPPTTYDAR